MRRLLGATAMIVALCLLIPKVPAADVSEQVAKLKSKDTDERRAAAKELAELGSEAKDAVPALIQALKDNDAFVRRFSAEALGKIGADSKAAAALEALLKNKSEKKEVQEAAVTALGNMGGLGVGALIAVLKDHEKENVVRRKAAEALGKIGKDAHSAVSALTEALNEKGPKEGKKAPPNPDDIKIELVNALGKVANAKDEDAIKALDTITGSKSKNKALMNAARDAAKEIKARQ
jgi:HEAT repeat protein